ncbi:MAG: EamA family transporter [Syntrophobacteraceae bacterium]
MITAVMIVVIIITNAAGDVLVTKGMKETGEVSSLKPRELILTAKKMLSQRSFLLGIFSLVLSFFAFLSVLSWADLSFVVPATSLVYVVSIVGARLFLKEKVSPMRWVGSLLVCLGVALICLP